MRSPSRTWPQRLVLSFNVLVVLGCLAAAAGLGWAWTQASALPRIDVGTSLTPLTSSSDVQNVLLVGIDDGMGLSSGDPVLRGRGKTLNTDTIMILRVDPKAQSAALLSLPRDLWVDIAGGGQGRINTALAIGGPERLIETIKQDFDIPINHYAMVDFQSFEALVSAIDGVPIYFNNPARDQATGLFQYDVGCINLTGDQALAFARSRHYEIWRSDIKQWQEDPSSDFGRITRQQTFIKAALRKAVAKGARNPFVLKEFLGIAQKNVTLDKDFKIGELVSLGTEFRNFDPDNLQSFTPVATGTMKGAASVLELNVAASQPIFEIFRGQRPIPDPNAETTTSTVPGSTTVPAGGGYASTTTTTQPVTTTTMSQFIPRIPDGQTCG